MAGSRWAVEVSCVRDADVSDSGDGACIGGEQTCAKNDRFACGASQERGERGGDGGVSHDRAGVDQLGAWVDCRGALGAGGRAVIAASRDQGARGAACSGGVHGAAGVSWRVVRERAAEDDFEGGSGECASGECGGDADGGWRV